MPWVSPSVARKRAAIPPANTALVSTNVYAVSKELDKGSRVTFAMNDRIIYVEKTSKTDICGDTNGAYQATSTIGVQNALEADDPDYCLIAQLRYHRLQGFATRNRALRFLRTAKAQCESSDMPCTALVYQPNMGSTDSKFSSSKIKCAKSYFQMDAFNISSCANPHNFGFDKCRSLPTSCATGMC
eukprot:CAMPEP_0196579458 /NCGR_PEP_ID=MMETSP1081-20130531/22014_1 /TAXON_ID=36882 /ORGANISM="Pyramimonas amylifera, Strain CCMP720" /LENGTH=185 /DNA_ID=CAMNT_0041899061 /DNA_START=319 /DNA_END=876 /DNA_ORIENTATION=-